MLTIKKHAWELTLLLLLILEILGFGLFNPLMLDLNVLLYSTSDFIYIGMLALPLTMIIISGGNGHFFRFNGWLMLHNIRRVI